MMKRPICLALVALLVISSADGQGSSQGRACEHEKLQLACPEGSVLQIDDAVYGRESTLICPGTNSGTTTSCRASESLSSVRDVCDGRTSCTVKAKNRVFGDPCYGVYKYLEVDYSCAASDTFRETVCEHDEMQLTCPENSALNIRKAVYGRKSKSICPGTRSRSTTSCEASESLSIVGGDCDGMTSCTVEAKNSVFGDPCYGVYKYLEVVYSCDSTATTEGPTEGTTGVQLTEGTTAA